MIPDRYFLLFFVFSWLFILSDLKASMQQSKMSKNNCCIVVILIPANTALFRVLSVNETDRSRSPVQPLKPQSHMTSMGLETDPLPDELFLLQNNTARYSAPDRGKQKQQQKQQLKYKSWCSLTYKAQKR